MKQRKANALTRTRLTLIFSAIMLVLLLGELLLVVPLVRRREIELSVALQNEIAEGVATHLDTDLQMVVERLWLFADRDEFRQMDALRMARILDEYVGSSLRLGAVFVLDEQGSVVAKTVSKALTGWADHPMEAPSFEALLQADGHSISEPGYDVATGSVYTQISVPIVGATGTRAGLLIGCMVLNDHIEHVQDWELPTGASLHMVTPGGIVLAQSGKDLFTREGGPLSLSSEHLPIARANASGELSELGRHIHADGSVYYGSFTTRAASGWAVIVETRVEAILSGSTALLRGLVGTSIALFLGAILTGHVLAKVLLVRRERLEEKFRSFYEQSPLSYQSLDGEMRLVDVNGKWIETLGYTKDEVIGRSFSEFISPEDGTRFAAGFCSLKSTGMGRISELDLVRKDGTILAASFSGSASYDDKGAFSQSHCVFTDITKQQKSADALRYRARQMETIADVGRQISSVLDLNELLSSVTGVVKERFGFYHVDLLLVDESREYVVFRAGSNPDDSEVWLKRGTRYAIGTEGMIGWAAHTGKTLLANDVSLDPHFVADDLLTETKSELVVPILNEGTAIGVIDAQSDRLDGFKEDDAELLEALAGQLSTAIDNAKLYEKLRQELAERVKAEHSLQQSERMYYDLLENANDLIQYVRPDGKLRFVNHAWLETLGYSQDEAVHLSVPDILRKDQVAKVMESMGAVARGARLSHFETVFVTKQGTEVCVEGSGSGIFENGELVGTLGMFRDITAKKRAEEEKAWLEAQLRQGQKLESIGTLASGVAHEINNPLMGMMNYAELVKDRVEDPKATEYLEEIGVEGNRIARIVRNLLSFARQDDEEHSFALIDDILNRSLSLVGSLLRKDQIVIEMDIPKDLPQVKCRSQQIQQVVVNLLNNARHALNERYPEYDANKLLRIEARPYTKDTVDCVRITIEDHGPGISEGLIQRIFDPFFTTKSRHEGTGLGLSVSYGIVTEHKGELTVESVPGENTRFHIDLLVDNGWTRGG